MRMLHADSLEAQHGSLPLMRDTGQEGMSKVLDQILGVCFPQGKPPMESLQAQDRKVSLLDKVCKACDLAPYVVSHCCPVLVQCY